jgi:hypothetical protein
MHLPNSCKNHWKYRGSRGRWKSWCNFSIFNKQLVITITKKKPRRTTLKNQRWRWQHISTRSIVRSNGIGSISTCIIIKTIRCISIKSNPWNAGKHKRKTWIVTPTTRFNNYLHMKNRIGSKHATWFEYFNTTC